MTAPAVSMSPSPRVTPLRVLLISHTCQSQVEGQPKAVELAKIDGIQLRVVVPDRWRHYGNPRGAEPKLVGAYDYRPTRVRWPWAGPAQCYLHHYPDMSRILRDFRPHVIDLWEEPWSLVSMHTIRLRNRLLPEAFIVSETEQNIDKRLPFPFERLRGYTLRHADFVVGRNRESLQIVRRKGFAGPAEVVPNAVDTSLFRPLDRARCRKTFGLENEFAVGYAGRLVEEKGIGDLLDALRVLPEGVVLLLAGEGPMRKTIEVRIDRDELKGRVRLLGALTSERLAEWYNAVDVVTVPSRTTPRWKEQFGRVIIEAQACATPVVASNSGAIPEVVGDAGIVVQEGSSSLLAQAILALRDDPRRRTDMGEHGLAKVRNEFTWEAVARRMNAIYGSLLENGPRR